MAKITKNVKEKNCFTNIFKESLITKCFSCVLCAFYCINYQISNTF